VPVDITPAFYKFEERLRDLMVAQGAHEHITSSLTLASGNRDQIVLVNALTADQNALRTDLVPGLTHVLSTYKKHKITDVPVFEIGKVFRANDNQYLEGRF
jgi:phenylalanyl-tRNA synthetase beta subunit